MRGAFAVEDPARQPGGGFPLVKSADTLAADETSSEHPFRTPEDGAGALLKEGPQGLGRDERAVHVLPERDEECETVIGQRCQAATQLCNR